MSGIVIDVTASRRGTGAAVRAACCGEGGVTDGGAAVGGGGGGAASLAESASPHKAQLAVAGCPAGAGCASASGARPNRSASRRAGHAETRDESLALGSASRLPCFAITEVTAYTL